MTTLSTRDAGRRRNDAPRGSLVRTAILMNVTKSVDGYVVDGKIFSRDKLMVRICMGTIIIFVLYLMYF
jgi:hypothetical protein